MIPTMICTYRPISYLFVLAAIIALISLHACSTSSDKTAETNTEKKKTIHPLTLQLKNHELANKIWHVNSQQFVEKNELLPNILQSDYILLGETHDNIEHHNGQLWVINELIKAKKEVGVAFEMISQSQADSADINGFKNAKDLITHLEKEETGWQYSAYYQALFDTVLSAKFDIYSANLSRESLMNTMRKGGKGVPPDIQRVLDNNPLGESPKESLKEEIIKSHCGVANEGMVKAMILGQRVRDAIMSEILLKARKDSSLPMVLIAGSGHVRNDRAVPMYLKNEDKGAKVISIAWLEVDEEANTVSDYAYHWKEGKLPFDYAWFTPQVERPDPCEEMRRMHQKHTEQAKKTQ